MDFRDVVDSVAKVAPTVATALGGPAAGAIAAMVAKLAGVEPTPEGMIHASQDPALQIKLAEIENSHAQKILELHLSHQVREQEEETKRLAEINATMRAELESGNVFKSGWRPFGGWVLMGCFALLNLAVVYAFVQDLSLVSDQQFTSLVIWLIAAQAAVQGVNIKKRSDDKVVARGERPPGFLGELVTRRKS